MSCRVDVHRHVRAEFFCAPYTKPLRATVHGGAAYCYRQYRVVLGQVCREHMVYLGAAIRREERIPVYERTYHRCRARAVSCTWEIGRLVQVSRVHYRIPPVTRRTTEGGTSYPVPDRAQRGPAAKAKRVGSCVCFVHHRSVPVANSGTSLAKTLLSTG